MGRWIILNCLLKCWLISFQFILLKLGTEQGADNLQSNIAALWSLSPEVVSRKGKVLGFRMMVKLEEIRK